MNFKKLSVLLGIGILVVAVAVWAFNDSHDKSCTQIFYDKPHQYVEVVKNQIVARGDQAPTLRPIESYQEGDVEQCPLNVYLGTEFDQKLPRTFLNDFLKTKKKVVWLGYNIWQLGERLDQYFGVRFLRLAKQEEKEILIAGRVLRGEADKDHVELIPTDLTKFETLAEVRLLRSKEVTPYIIRSANRHYFADIQGALFLNVLSLK